MYYFISVSAWRGENSSPAAEVAPLGGWTGKVGGAVGGYFHHERRPHPTPKTPWNSPWIHRL